MTEGHERQEADEGAGRDRGMLDRQMDHLSQAGVLGKRLAMGLGTCSCLGAEFLQVPGPRQRQRPELRPESSLCTHKQEGTGVGFWEGGFEGCGCQGTSEPPQEHPLQKEIPNVG